MESLTYLKNIKITPKKMRMFLDKVKVMKPVDALDYLMYAPDKAAKTYHSAIKSAIHNAMIALKVNADVLQFKLFTIEEGQSLRRYRAGSRGSAKPIKRRFSHIKIILEAEQPEPKKKIEKKVKEDKKKEAPKETKKVAKKAEKKTEKKEVSEVKETAKS